MIRPVLLLICLFLYNCAKGQDPYRRYMDSVKNSYIGKDFPAFDVKALDGKTVSNKTIKGKAVFINYWYDLCAPCRAEVEGLNALYDSLKSNKDFVFIAITFEPKDKLPEIIKQQNIKYPVATVPRAQLEQIPILMGYPTNVILNKEGKMIFIKNGGPTNASFAAKKIREEILPIVKSQL